MIKSPALSGRLTAVVSLVSRCGAVIDIGSDHAYVPIWLTSKGICERALACDIGTGPLERASEHIESYGLAGKIGIVLSDGLASSEIREFIRQNHSAKCVLTISGMGGILMTKILKDAEDILPLFTSFILQPQSDPDRVRSFLSENGYRIQDESMLMEDGKYYTVILAVPGTMRLREEEAVFGPCLLAGKDPVLFGYLQKQRSIREEILRSLTGRDTETARERTEEIMHELDVIRFAEEYYES